jgi:ferritin-like metal-binding protein YciE
MRPLHIRPLFARPFQETRSMSIATLQDMFVHGLKDIHYAEAKILKTLPNLIEAAEYEELRHALSKHRSETEKQISRLREVFQLIGEEPSAERCEAIEGILAEGESLMRETSGTAVSDIGIIASGQAVEHYEIVRYRSLVRWAEALGLVEARNLLQESLTEELVADEKLTALASLADPNAGIEDDEGEDEDDPLMDGNDSLDEIGGLDEVKRLDEVDGVSSLSPTDPRSPGGYA